MRAPSRERAQLFDALIGPPTCRYHVTQSGDPARRQTVLLPLLTRWAQVRFVDNDPAPQLGKAKRVLRVVARRA